MSHPRTHDTTGRQAPAIGSGASILGARFQAQPNYDAWRVRPDEFRQLSDLLRWAVLAPSSHNTQPWAFEVAGDSIVVSPDPGRALAVSDPTGREQYLSLGAAIANLKVAARRFELGFEETQVATAEGAAALRLDFRSGSAPDRHELALFEAIPARTMNRGPHLERELPADFRRAASRLAAAVGAEARLVEDDAALAAIGELLGEADRRVMGDLAFMGELSTWVRPNSTRAYDGMPGFTFGISDFPSRMFPAIARSGKMAEVGPELDRALIAQQTAAVAVLAAERDDPATWLRVGELFQRICLEATARGLAIHVYAALVETDPFPDRLRELLGLRDRPLMMFRVGYPAEGAAHAPRRPASATRMIGPADRRHPLPDERPTIFRLAAHGYTLADLLDELGDVTVVDRLGEDWLSELFIVRHPELDFSTTEARQAVEDAAEPVAEDAGVWVYYPWKRTLIHLPEREDFLELLYVRNFPSIDRETQRRIGELRVAVGGLSVGSNIARALAMLGVQHLRVADFDAVAPSNNNRLGAGSVLDVGRRKTEVLAQQLYEFNPFFDLRVHGEGVTEANLPDLMGDLDVFIDHLDDLPLKVAAREEARRRGVIVLMATELAFTPIFDVELPGDQAYFGGRVSAEQLDELRTRPEKFADFIRLAVTLFGGPENIPPAKLENYVAVARNELNFVSQLGPTGYAAAGQLAYLVYEIARGKAGGLERSKRLHLEQPSLVDTAQQRRAIAAYRRAFG